MSIEELAEEVDNCRKCGLWKTRNNVVVGGGSIDSEIMLVGEAPGYNEDKQGEPFVGRAGDVLDMLLETIGIGRENVYIANILKCRPPKNRNPMKEEIKACTPYLDRQIEIVRPRIICPMGNFAAGYIMEKFGLKPDSIGSIHGQVFKIRNLLLKGSIIPLYHPAAAVYNPDLKAVLMQDFRLVSRVKNDQKI